MTERRQDRYIRTASLVIPALLLGCSSPTGSSGGTPQGASSYINFYAYWGDSTPTPAVVRVSVYRVSATIPEETRQTTSDGYFYSAIKYDTSADYQVYLHDTPTGACLATTIISFHSTQPWPVEQSEFNVVRSVPVGPLPPNNNDLSGCPP